MQVRDVWRIGGGFRFWQTRTLPLGQQDWDRLPSSLQPHQRAEQNALLCAVRRAVDEHLSGGQRRVFTAVTLHGVPGDALAVRWDLTGTRSARRCSKRAASCAPAWQLTEEILRTFREPLRPVRPGWIICSLQTRGMRDAI
jgi:hypothetical protein